MDEQQPPVNAIGDVPVVDMNVYSAAEREPALSTTGPLNWGGGDYVTTPAYVPSEPLHGLQSTPNVRGHGERMGVDEITR